MRLFDIIRTLRDLPSGFFDVIRTIGWDRLKDLIDLPDFEHELEVRKWLQLTADVSEELATLTDTKVDDFIAEIAQKALESDALWSVIYGLISRVAKGEEVEVDVENADLCAAAESVGFSAIAIAGFISVAIQIIKLLREFRQRRKS